MNAARSTRFTAVLAAAGLLCLVVAIPASAGSPPPYPQGWNHRPHHLHHPVHYHQAGPRYVVVDRLPRGCQHVVYRGQPYYRYGPNWYQPYGARFAVVSPPAGLVIDRRGVALAAWVPLVRW